MDGTCQTPHQDKLEPLKKILPEAFSEGKIRLGEIKSNPGGRYKL